MNRQWQKDGLVPLPSLENTPDPDSDGSNGGTGVHVTRSLSLSALLPASSSGVPKVVTSRLRRRRAPRAGSSEPAGSGSPRRGHKLRLLLLP